MMMGSGGGDNFGAVNYTGYGGASLWLKVSGSLILNGLVDASGNDSTTAQIGGGGAGGSINLCDSVSISGSGALHVDGGKGFTLPSFGSGGGGGGGRICAPVSRFMGTLSAIGGTAEDGAQPGQSGTIYRLPATIASGDSVSSLTSYRPDMSVASVIPAPGDLPYQVAFGQSLAPVTPFYELSPSGATFDPPAIINFVFDTAGVDMLTVHIYRYNPVSE
jgi:hypothetical protein